MGGLDSEHQPPAKHRILAGMARVLGWVASISVLLPPVPVHEGAHGVLWRVALALAIGLEHQPRRALALRTLAVRVQRRKHLQHTHPTLVTQLTQSHDLVS
jgi:hypothetical protein